MAELTDYELKEMALKAICFTRDYVEPKVSLPPIKGWDWFDAGCALAASIPESEWARQFCIRAKEGLQDEYVQQRERQ